MRIVGQATQIGTQKYRQRHFSDCAPGHFREVNGLVFSSFGIGTYLGQPDEQTDTLVTNATVSVVRSGLNLIDTAINYRYMHGEWSVRAALSRLLSEQIVSREELILCTKGGFIPHPDRVDWFSQEYANNGNFSISASDLVAGCHCMHPEYLHDQLNRSLDNLGVETIDIYYIHNPETQLSQISTEVFYQRLYQAFEVMEAAVKAGKIRAYGLATWSGFRVPPTEPNYIDLAYAKALASQAAGDSTDSFQFIQLPLNAAMTEALVKPTQKVRFQLIPALEAACHLGIAAIASASLGQTQALGKIPASMTSSLSELVLTEAQQALQFTRSCPGLLSALVGMKTPSHVISNLALTSIEPLPSSCFQMD